MDFLTELLKQLSISRAFVVALFVTSSVMFFGAQYASHVVPPVPADWAPVLFGCMVLSGCLSVLWGLCEAWAFVTRAIQKVRKTINSMTLSAQETEVLLAMGSKPNQPIDLERLDYRDNQLTHLELSALMRSLQAKGYVAINGWGGESATLTELGREKALKLQRKEARENIS